MRRTPRRSVLWALGLCALSSCLGKGLPQPPPGPSDGAAAPPTTVPQPAAARGAGAVPTASWPAHGTAGVPPELPLAALRFEGPATERQQAPRLESATGGAVAVDVQPVECREIGWADGWCVALRPRGDLAPSTPHRLLVTASDADGETAEWEAHFRTGPSTPEPLTWLELPCGIDERPVEGGCVLADDGSIHWRLRASAPVRAWLEGEGRGSSTVASRGELELMLAPFPAGHEIVADLRVIDLAGREKRQLVLLSTMPLLAPVYISEVRADPHGPEPAQEYVEVVNSSDVPIDLRGFALSDRTDRIGDVIERSELLAPRARALLVADTFDPSHPDDPPVSSGAPLIRLGTSLASGGLRNAGEAVYLRDPQGRRVSAAPAVPAPRPGVCVVRTSQNGRTGEVGSFGYDARDGCTPGQPDRTEP